jgi:hypothetical protein
MNTLWPLGLQFLVQLLVLLHESRTLSVGSWWLWLRCVAYLMTTSCYLACDLLSILNGASPEPPVESTHRMMTILYSNRSEFTD